MMVRDQLGLPIDIGQESAKPGTPMVGRLYQEAPLAPSVPRLLHLPEGMRFWIYQRKGGKVAAAMFVKRDEADMYFTLGDPPVSAQASLIRGVVRAIGLKGEWFVDPVALAWARNERQA